MKTAVEFLKEKLTYVFVNDKSFNELFKQAKAIEKEQIIEAHGNKQKLSKGATNYEYTLTGEMYYNEKFKSE